MNIDLTNKWVRKLVAGCDLTNGCALARGIIHNCMRAVAWLVIWTVVAYICIAIVVGSLLTVYSYIVGGTYDVKLQWLGDSMLAHHLAFGAACGMVILVMVGCLSVLFGVIISTKFIYNRLPAAKLIINATKSITGRVCPKINVILPARHQNLYNKIIRFKDDNWLVVTEPQLHTCDQVSIYSWGVRRINPISEGGDFHWDNYDYLKYYLDTGNTNWDFEIIGEYVGENQPL